MIRNVTDRLIAGIRPNYIGRHRRERPRVAAVLRCVPTAGQEVSGSQ